MLRVSHLRKLVKPTPCLAPVLEPLITLSGAEVGAPVSAGLPVNILEGTVVATGAGYDFTNAVLSVNTAENFPVSSKMTFSITGTGPVPPLVVRASGPDLYNLVAVRLEYFYAAYKHPGLYNAPPWAIKFVPVTIPAGDPYELKCSIADTWVGVWLNGTRIARAAVAPGYLESPYPWEVLVGRYTYETYTGHVDSVSLANGALCDIDVL